MPFAIGGFLERSIRPI